MKQHLLWKLLVNILPIIGVVVLVIWWAIDQLAADYFMHLMERYAIEPHDSHQMFLAAVHRYLLWASLAAIGLALLLNYLLTKRVLRPLSQMTAITRQVAAGDFSARVEVASEDEVGQLGLAFNRMADSLAELEQLRKGMVTDVAHELRTPLTNLRGYLEALSDAVIPPSAETFQMLQQEILRLVHLIDDLQQLAKADAAKAYLDYQPLSLPELIGQVLELFRPRLQTKGISVRSELQVPETSLNADPERLLQALRNLMENAWRYTPPGGRIVVSCRPTADRFRVCFANSGPGIDPQDLPYIFERFFRGDRSRSREHGGAGIGLAIVKELIEAHGGQVDAESTAEETRICFSLPL